MGNTQKSLKGKIKGLFNRPQHPDTKIGKASQCPNCGLKFNQNATYLMYNAHLQSCLRHELSEDGDEPYFEESLQPPQHLMHTAEGELIYEKVPINDEHTQFKWERRPQLMAFPSEIFSLSPESVSKRCFQEKLAWFRSKVERFRIPWESGADWMKIEKDNVLMTSLAAIRKVNMHKEVKIDFVKEKVNDAGGLLREWMHLAIKEIFDESTGIFALCNTPEVMYKIRSDRDLDPEFAQSLFMLFGIILGKAIFERIPLNCYLDRTLLRQLCSQKVKLSDVSGYDAQLYKSWNYLVHHKIEPFGQYFCLYQETSNKNIEQVPLVEQGDKLQVNEQNKHEFVQLSMQYYCVTSIAKHISVVQNSLYKIIPANLLSVFDTYELEMILYGVPFISVEDWCSNTEYKGAYYKNHQIIKWFWKLVKEMDQQQLGKLLHFCTGSTRIPIYGFKKLQSNRGNYAKFLVESVAFSKINPFPKAHTCFNRLQLPMYPTEELLRTHVMSIVSNNLDGIYGLD